MNSVSESVVQGIKPWTSAQQYRDVLFIEVADGHMADLMRFRGRKSTGQKELRAHNASIRIDEFHATDPEVLSFVTYLATCVEYA